MGPQGKRGAVPQLVGSYPSPRKHSNSIIADLSVDGFRDEIGCRDPSDGAHRGFR